ncbi:MAG: CapA family protein [Anaerotardibacter sp.]
MNRNTSRESYQRNTTSARSDSRGTYPDQARPIRNQNPRSSTSRTPSPRSAQRGALTNKYPLPRSASANQQAQSAYDSSRDAQMDSYQNSYRNTSSTRRAREVIDGRDDLNYAKHSTNRRDYLAQSPTANTHTYVGHTSRKREKLLLVIVSILLIVVIAFAAKALFFSSTPEENTQENLPAATDTEVQEVSFTVSFAGDCTLGTDENFSYSGSLPEKYESVTPDYFLANFADYFSADDLTIVNMEGTLTESTTRQDKTFAFKGPAEYAQILTQGNVEAASMANNHSKDYGEQSYTDTINTLEAAGISCFGYDRISYMDVKGVKVALIGTYELALGAGIKDEMLTNIQTAKDNGAQVIMVYFHWGSELETVPDSTQIELGHAAIDAGADLVIGSHPHVIQGYEKYNGRYIVYSLGNFCFGGNPNPTSKDCMVFQQTFTVRGNEVATDDNINVIPVSVSSVSSYNNYQPTPAEGSEAERILEKIKASNDAIAQKSSAATN